MTNPTMKEFLTELQALVIKHDVTIEALDNAGISDETIIFHGKEKSSIKMREIDADRLSMIDYHDINYK